MRRVPLGLVAAALWAGAVGCGEGQVSGGGPNEQLAAAVSETRDVTFHLVFVHGVYSQTGPRSRAERSLSDLESYVRAGLVPAISEYEAAHPGVRLHFETYRINLYTDLLNQVISPAIDDVSDGTGVPTATLWRSQLSSKLTAVLPADARNVVLIGHSTGGKVSMEVAADVSGAGTVGGFDWGWRDRIAGVVTINGIIDALQRPQYNFIGWLSYITGCKVLDGDGWCEYSGHISAVPAATWVANHKRALMLIAGGSCSPSVWTGQNDQVVPITAQGVPAAYGMVITPTPDTLGPAHGLPYGAFCHTDISDGASPRHIAAKQAVGDQILHWLFYTAPRVVNPEGQRFNVPAIPRATWSPAFSVGGSCPTGDIDYSWPHVIGSCGHPGVFDGDDHPLNQNNRTEIIDLPCAGRVRWQHLHSGKNPAKLWMKAYSQPPGGGLISTME